MGEARDAFDGRGRQANMLFQSAAPTALYLSADRPDVHFATSWIMRGTREPQELHELEIKRLAAYLATHLQLAWRYKHGAAPDEIGSRSARTGPVTR